MSRENGGNDSKVEEGKKVGILTFHYTTNYGGVLQAYALSKLIQGMGLSCDVIDYRQPLALKVYIRHLFLRRDFIASAVKVFRFSFFIRKKMSLSGKIIFRAKKLSRVCEKYDAVVVGSDEVWKTSSFRGYDSAFFLDFLGREKARVSFSASLGSTPSFSDRRADICAALGKFASISVRDTRSKNILNSECGIEAEQLLDPTLLVDCWDELRSAFKVGTHGGPYVLIYGKLNADELGVVKAFAKHYGYRVISVGERNVGVDPNCITAGPGEWLNYVSSAKFVFTTFFHGVIFSLNFHEEVFVFRREDKSYKIDQLAEDLALVMERDIGFTCVQNGCELRRYKFSEETKVLIDRAKHQATQFLMSAIGTKRQDI